MTDTLDRSQNRNPDRGAPRRLTLQPQALTAATFAPYGAIVQAGNQTPIIINEGNTERFHAMAEVELAEAADKAVISIFSGQPRTMPMTIKMLERHPLGSQFFQPLSNEPYLVLVAPGAEVPDLDQLTLFLAQPNQGVQYSRNTWHHPLLALNKPCDFLVVDREGDGDNLEEFFFPGDIQVEIQLS